MLHELTEQAYVLHIYSPNVVGCQAGRLTRHSTPLAPRFPDTAMFSCRCRLPTGDVLTAGGLTGGLSVNDPPPTTLNTSQVMTTG